MRSVITINRRGSYLDSVKVAIASSDPDVFCHGRSARICSNDHAPVMGMLVARNVKPLTQSQRGTFLSLSHLFPNHHELSHGRQSTHSLPQPAYTNPARTHLLDRAGYSPQGWPDPLLYGIFGQLISRNAKAALLDWALLSSDLQFIYLDPVLNYHLEDQAELLVGKSLLSFVHPDERASAKRDLGNVLESKTLYGSVTRCVSSLFP